MNLLGECKYKIYKLSYCKFCIYTHPVNSKFTIWQCHNVNSNFIFGYLHVFEKSFVPFTQGWFVPSLLKISPVASEKYIFFAISLLCPPCCRVWPLKKLEFPLHRDGLCQVWLILEKKIFKFHWRIMPLFSTLGKGHSPSNSL